MILAARQIDDRDLDELQAVAYHEAGHAVCALAFRCKVDSVSIRHDPQANTWGSVWCDPPLTQVRQIAIAVSGYIAEQVCRRVIVTNLDDDAKDMRDVLRALRSTYPADVPPYSDEFAAGILLALKVITQHKKAVKRIANRLLAVTDLDGAAVRRLARIEGRYATTR